MKNLNVHNKINLRAMMIESETIRNIKQYGKESATVNSINFKHNIGLMVSFILKPVLQNS